MKYQWYHTAYKCDECEHQFVRDMRHYHNRIVTCPKCKSKYVMVDAERDLDITEAIATC